MHAPEPLSRDPDYANALAELEWAWFDRISPWLDLIEWSKPVRGDEYVYF